MQQKLEILIDYENGGFDVTAVLNADSSRMMSPDPMDVEWWLLSKLHAAIKQAGTEQDRQRNR